MKIITLVLFSIVFMNAQAQKTKITEVKSFKSLLSYIGKNVDDVAVILRRDKLIKESETSNSESENQYSKDLTLFSYKTQEHIDHLKGADASNIVLYAKNKSISGVDCFLTYEFQNDIYDSDVKEYERQFSSIGFKLDKTEKSEDAVIKTYRKGEMVAMVEFSKSSEFSSIFIVMTERKYID
jgi:hypothetical protein